MECGSNFYIYLCCGYSWPWFMVGRIGNKLSLPNASFLAFCALLCSVGSVVCFSFGSAAQLPLTPGQRAGLIIGWAVLTGALCFLVSLVRGSFRAAYNVPGTPGEDLCQSTPWVFCLPCYERPYVRPMQYGFPFQLALMETKVAQATVEAQQGSGAAKGGALPAAATPPPQVYVPGRDSKWSSDLFDCTCNSQCEGNCPVLCCSFLYGWWMQTRLLQRIGKIQSHQFWQWGCGLGFLEGLPDIVDAIGSLANAAGTLTLDVVGILAQIPIIAVNFWLRKLVRERYNIEESFCCQDCLVATFCYPCSIAQIDREMTARGELV